MTTKHIWIVEGDHTMHCNGCAKSVEYALSRVPGIQQVKADHRNQTVEVETTDPEALARVVAELRDLGYEAREVSR